MNTPADNVLALLSEYAPEATEAIVPIIPKLFNALADGHSFIFVNAEEQALLAQAEPIVSHYAHSPLVLNKNRLLFGRFWQLEQQLAHEIKRLSAPTHAIADPKHIATQLQQLFPDTSSRDQQAAAALALSQNFTVISGGPGTGKTTTVAKLLVLLSGDQQPRIALAAPTGKAAARMSEALKNAVSRIADLPDEMVQFLNQLDGQTVHRLLGLKPPQMQPEYHAHNRLPLDILIIDEASMLDAYLLLQVLQALPDHCRIILLGDEHQLPSVNAGAVLSALVRSSRPLSPDSPITALLPHLPQTLTPPVARLTISHRFDDTSGIGCLARAVVEGDGITAWAQFDRFPNELSHQQNNITQQAQLLYQYHQAYWQAIDAHDIAQAFQHQTDIVVLTAHRQDAEQFNQSYRHLLQHHGRARAETPWFAGQMLMITRNDPATRLFNGDVGIVMPHQHGLATWFPDANQTFRAVPISRLPAHEPAFAMTVHKSQGSEYQQVWLLPPQANDDESGFSRSLLYTAITRAKRQFIYWGNESSFQSACETPDKRRTLLAELLS